MVAGDKRSLTSVMVLSKRWAPGVRLEVAGDDEKRRRPSKVMGTIINDVNPIAADPIFGLLARSVGLVLAAIQ